MLRSRALQLLNGAALAAALSACSLVSGGGDEFRGVDAAARTVSPDEVARRVIGPREIRRHVGYLASDEMRGRDTPSPELERAASWIAERFGLAGLEPAGQDGGFIQFWPYERSGLTNDGSAPTTGRAVQVPNVVGIVPGSDAARAGEYVILTAHFDHVGVGTPTEDGDSVYNGADDNASGTAALLEIARAFGSLALRPARPILFLATSGEEKGLLGATWFASNPTVFLSDAVAVLNMDMVGRNSPDSIGLVGHDYSSLGPLLVRIAADSRHLRLYVDTDPAPGENLFTRSDHYPFARTGIPAIAVTSALHEHYHHPDDEPGRIDADKAARVARLIFLAAYELARGEDATWTEEGKRAVR